jgi:DNA polymerase III subunit gamma/tau
MQQISLSARPRTLDALVGQEKTVARIRGHIAAGRTVKAWMFTGPRGTGKTTISRVLALSLQCKHGTFGKPCKVCYSQRSSFDIYEINAGKNTGIDAMREALSGEDNYPRTGEARVYILDELQKASDGAQSLLLKSLEDTPETTVYIICTTAPHKIIETVQSRCICYQMKDLETDDITILVTKLLTKVGSQLPVDRLVDSLTEKSIGSPRLIAQAVEKYVAGATPDEAAEVEASTTVDTKALCRSVIKGDWVGVAKYLQEAQSADVRAIRLGCIGYLRSILLQSSEVSERTNAVAKAVTILTGLQNAEDLVVSGGLAAALYQVCSYFAKYQH